MNGAGQLGAAVADPWAAALSVDALERALDSHRRWLIAAHGLTEADLTTTQETAMPVFLPVDDQVLIRRLAAVETAAGGKLHIPGRAQERPLEGVVVAVGPGRMVRGLASPELAELEALGFAPDGSGGRWDLLVRVLRSAVREHQVPCQLRPGQRVLFRKYAGTDVRFDDVDHIIVREGEVLGVIEELAGGPAIGSTP